MLLSEYIREFGQLPEWVYNRLNYCHCGGKWHDHYWVEYDYRNSSTLVFCEQFIIAKYNMNILLLPPANDWLYVDSRFKCETLTTLYNEREMINMVFHTSLINKKYRRNILLKVPREYTARVMSLTNSHGVPYFSYINKTLSAMRLSSLISEWSLDDVLLVRNNIILLIGTYRTIIFDNMQSIKITQNRSIIVPRGSRVYYNIKGHPIIVNVGSMYSIFFATIFVWPDIDGWRIIESQN